MKDLISFEIRPFEKKDLRQVMALLSLEGYTREDSAIEDCFTCVLTLEDAGLEDEIIGFFTFEPGLNLKLKHFLVAKEFRNLNHHNCEWGLIKYVKNIARINGFGQMIVHGKGRRMIRFLRAYFRTLPYGQAEDGTCFFLVRV